MNITFLVSSVLTNTAERLSIPPFSATTNVTLTQAITWLNQSLESLQALARQKQGLDYDLLTTQALTTTPNLATIPLPAGFGELHDILWVKTSHTVIPLEVMTKDDLVPDAFDPREWIAPPRYRLETSLVRFAPCPNQAYQLQVWFTNQAAIASGSDSVTGRLDWSQWLELDLCSKCCQRKRRQADLAEFMSLKRDLAADMFSLKRRRDQNAVPSVRDVGIYGEYEGFPGRYWDH